MTATELRNWRKRLALAQRSAAERIGVSLRQYQNYEGGHAPIPLTVRLACAAIALGLRDFPKP